MFFIPKKWVHDCRFNRRGARRWALSDRPARTDRRIGSALEAKAIGHGQQRDRHDYDDLAIRVASSEVLLL